jgi:hypothetical protein
MCAAASFGNFLWVLLALVAGDHCQQEADDGGPGKEFVIFH